MMLSFITHPDQTRDKIRTYMKRTDQSASLFFNLIMHLIKAMKSYKMKSEVITSYKRNIKL
jgi:hypothetical protein